MTFERPLIPVAKKKVKGHSFPILDLQQYNILLTSSLTKRENSDSKHVLWQLSPVMIKLAANFLFSGNGKSHNHRGKSMGLQPLFPNIVRPNFERLMNKVWVKKIKIKFFKSFFWDENGKIFMFENLF